MKENDEWRREARRSLDLDKIASATSQCFSFKSRDRTMDYPKWHHWGRRYYNIKLLFKKSLIQNPKLPMIVWLLLQIFGLIIN